MLTCMQSLSNIMIAFLFLNVFCSSCNNSNTARERPNKHFVNCVVVSTDSLIKENEQLRLNIDVRYPKLLLDKNSAYCSEKKAKQINHINEIINNIISSSVSEINEVAIYNTKNEIDSSLYIEIKQILSSDSLFQVILEYNQDGIGPRPISGFININYDLNKNKLLDINDIIRINNSFLSMMNNQIKIKFDYYDCPYREKNLAYKVFLLQPDGIDFYFSDAQIERGCESKMIHIPRSLLNPYLLSK